MDLHTAVGGASAALPISQIPPLFVVVMIVFSDPTIHPWFESEK